MNIHLIHHHHPHRHSLHCLHSSTSNPIPLTITLSFTLNFFASHYLHHSLHTPISLTSYQLHFLRSLLTFFSLFLFFLLCDFGSASNEEAKVSLPIRFSPSILWLNWFFEKIEIVFRIWRVNPFFIFTLTHPIISLSLPPLEIHGNLQWLGKTEIHMEIGLGLCEFLFLFSFHYWPIQVRCWGWVWCSSKIMGLLHPLKWSLSFNFICGWWDFQRWFSVGLFYCVRVILFFLFLGSKFCIFL